jgi:hypothetical protein
MLGNATCTEERACPAHKFWTAHRAKVYDFLKMTNVADIASFEARRRWKTTLALQAGPTPGTISRGDSIPPSHHRGHAPASTSIARAPGRSARFTPGPLSSRLQAATLPDR